MKAQSFLQEQIDDYEARLTEAENRLANFKRENVAFMPDQRGDYFDRLQQAERNLESTRAQLRLAEEKRAELNRQLEGEEPIFGFASGGSNSPTTSGYSAAKIRELELELDQLRLQYTDRHPRIRQILETIEMLEKASAEEQAAGASSSPYGGASMDTPLEVNPVYQNMRIQLSNTEVEIASLRAELRQHTQEVNSLQEMVDTVPRVEAELARLNRDYGVVKSKYEQLLIKLETANIGEDVEASIDEKQFRMIEPTFASTTPVGPKRQLLAIVVFVFALGLGGALALVLDQVHPVFFSTREVKSVTGLPVLGAVEFSMSAAESRARHIGHIRVGLVFSLLVTVFILVVVSTEAISPVARNLAGMV